MKNKKTNHFDFNKMLRESDVLLHNMEDLATQDILIGNGDCTALCFEEDGDIIVNVCKNDLWDMRLDTSLDKPIKTNDEIINILNTMKKEKYTNDEVAKFNRNISHAPSYHDNPYPCPLLGCHIRIKYKKDEKNSKAFHLCLDKGMLVCYLGGRVLSIYVHAEKNVIVVHGLCKSIEACVEPIFRTTIDKPTVVTQDGKGTIIQQVPGDVDVDGITYVIDYQTTKTTMFMAIVTSNNTNCPKEQAQKLLLECKNISVDKLLVSHLAWWNDFWSKSCIYMDDPIMVRAWYRSLFYLACCSREGKTAPALFVAQSDEQAPWHGDYHMNINFQLAYWGCYAANHPNMAEPYDAIINGYLKRAKWLAREVFNVEGAFYPHVIMLGETDNPLDCKSNNNRQYFHEVWSRTLGVPAFCVQNLWWRYEYTMDKNVLKENYDAIKEVAKFYVNYGKLWPTVSPEHWGLTSGMEKNKNGTFDICMIKFVLRAAIKGGEVLGEDIALLDKWKQYMDSLPGYPTYGEDERVIVDVENAPPIAYNIPVPVYPVFPGEDIDNYSPKEERELAKRTVINIKKHYSFRDPLQIPIAYSRLDMEGAFEYLRDELVKTVKDNGTFGILPTFHRFNKIKGIATQNAGVILPITELLLQGHRGIIRLFPAWGKVDTEHQEHSIPPKAGFKKLRVKGGFLISANYNKDDKTEIKDIFIESTAGGTAKVENKWGDVEIIDDQGENISYSFNNGNIVFDTKVGMIYEIIGK